MAQSSGSCTNSPSGHSYYKFCCRSPALHVITSHSEAPSLSGETYISATEEESDFYSGVRLATYQPDKYSPTRIQKMKSKHMTYPRTERQFQNFCNGDDYLPKTFKTVCNGNGNGCLPDCPVHSKICKKPVDINKLEESYWAQWKPGKCDSKMSVCKINEKIKPKIPTPPKMPPINLANYVQCKTCHKYIEKDRIQPDCIRCLHRNLDIIDSESSELESHPFRMNRTIQEDDENESVEDEVANGTLTGFVMTPDYTSELTENSRESVSHRKLHRLGARPSHRVNRTSSRQNEQVACIAKCSKCRSSETTTSTAPSKRYETTTDNTGSGRSGASLIDEVPEKEEKRVSTPRTETKSPTEVEKEAVQPIRESETPRRGLRRVFHLNTENAAAEPQETTQLQMVLQLDKDATVPQPVRESEAPRRLRRIFHLDSIQSEPRKSESVDTTDTRPSTRLSNQAKLGTSKRIFIRPHSYPLRTGRTAARGNGRNTSRGRRR